MAKKLSKNDIKALDRRSRDSIYSLLGSILVISLCILMIALTVAATSKVISWI